MNKPGLVVLAMPLIFTAAFVYTSRTVSRINVVQASEEKVVKIGVVSAGGRIVGSGALISPDGLVLSCAHLFRNPGKIFVKTASGQTYLARLVRVDHKVDLSVLKIDALEPLPYFRFGPPPILGQFVMAFGSPLDLQGMVSFGYVERLNTSPGRYTVQGCPINPGNSGGPLVDGQGRLIGVNVAVLALNIFQMAQGLGLTVNLDTILEFVRL